MRDLGHSHSRHRDWPETLARSFRLCLAVALILGHWSTPASASERFNGVVSVIPEWPGRPPNLAEPEGSGVVVLGGRHVVTALHVIGEADNIEVRPDDGRRIPARVVGAYLNVVGLADHNGHRKHEVQSNDGDDGEIHDCSPSWRAASNGGWLIAMPAFNPVLPNRRA